MKKNNPIENLYDNFWKFHQDEFSSYGRNLVIKQFFKKTDRVLDIGCGDGTVAAYLKQTIGVDIVGVDISMEAVIKARNKGLTIKHISAEEKLPFSDNSFDVVFWGDNIEHLFNPDFTAKEIKRVLKSNGRLILSTPNFGYWRYRLYYLLKGRLPDTEWSGLPPWGWSHIRFFNLQILKDLLFYCGFKKVATVVGISSKRLDKPLIGIFPSLFGMILVVEVT